MRRVVIPMPWFGMLIGAVLLLLLPGFAAADTTFVSIGLPPVSGPSFLPPFDTSLGTLTSVDVTITGQISAEVLTQTNFVTTEDGELLPVPVPFSVAVDLNMFGIPNGSFFSWLQPATFSLSGTGSGAGEIQNLSDFFNIGFHFDSSTDFVGQTPVSSSGPLIPPALAFGTLNGWTNTFSPVMMEFTEVTPSAFLPDVGASLITQSVQGDILVQYNYTPASTTPAPEPGTLMLLGSGLLALAARRNAKASTIPKSK